MEKLTLLKTIILPAPAEHVWTFLTDPEKLGFWFNRGQKKLVQGGDWKLLANTLGKEGEVFCYGKVLEIRPPRKLVHTFSHEWINGAETTCSWTLQPLGGQTLLTLRHEGWENVREIGISMAASHEKGWDEHLASFRRCVQ